MKLDKLEHSDSSPIRTLSSSFDDMPALHDAAARELSDLDDQDADF